MVERSRSGIAPAPAEEFARANRTRSAATLAGELFGRARAALGESADYLDAIRLIESQTGVEIRG